MSGTASAQGADRNNEPAAKARTPTDQLTGPPPHAGRPAPPRTFGASPEPHPPHRALRIPVPVFGDGPRLAMGAKHPRHVSGETVVSPVLCGGQSQLGWRSRGTVDRGTPGLVVVCTVLFFSPPEEEKLSYAQEQAQRHKLGTNGEPKAAVPRTKNACGRTRKHPPTQLVTQRPANPQQPAPTLYCCYR